MYYTGFSIELPNEEAATNIAATIAHVFAGCGCPEDCECNTPEGSCSDCHFEDKVGSFQCTIAQAPSYYIHSVYTRPGEMLHVDIYSEAQFSYHGLRELTEALRSYAKEGHLIMTHGHRDFLTGEQASGKVSDHVA